MTKEKPDGKKQKPSACGRLRQLVPLILFGVVIVAFLLIYYFQRPQGIEGLKEFSVVITAGGISETLHMSSTAEFLREAMEEEGLIGGEDTEFGLWVQMVGGRVADEAQMEWWSISINGDFAMTGVDDTPIVDGDVFEFSLMVGYDDFF